MHKTTFFILFKSLFQYHIHTNNGNENANHWEKKRRVLC